uniref:Uncharacterized protein n=1 Tax=Wuchereria bancrofti TaxID=6293 RepID=A0AAF5Q5S6_WUCBA
MFFIGSFLEDLAGDALAKLTGEVVALKKISGEMRHPETTHDLACLPHWKELEVRHYFGRRQSVIQSCSFLEDLAGDALAKLTGEVVALKKISGEMRHPETT